MKKMIEIGVRTYYHLLYSAFLIEVISNDASGVVLKKGALISLVVGSVTFPLIVCLIFHQEKYVKYVVAKHLKERGEEDVVEEQGGESEALEEEDVQEDKEKIGEKDGKKEIIELMEPKTEVKVGCEDQE